MTAREASQQIRAFLASGHGGSVTFHVSPATEPGKHGTIAAIEVLEKLRVGRAEDGRQILDMLGGGD